MIITVTESIFIDHFQSIRPENFSHRGLQVLFEHLEEVDFENSMELDVIAICCDYSEGTLEEAFEHHGVSDCYELNNATTFIPLSRRFEEDMPDEDEIDAFDENEREELYEEAMEEWLAQRVIYAT
jgi:hypothetical protein